MDAGGGGIGDIHRVGKALQRQSQMLKIGRAGGQRRRDLGGQDEGTVA